MKNSRALYLISVMNEIEQEIREEYESLCEAYGDHTDDLELAYSQRESEYDQILDGIWQELRSGGYLAKYSKGKYVIVGVKRAYR